MTRSLKRGPFVDYHLLSKVRFAIKTKSKKVIKTWSRRSMILPEMIGLIISVHNGRKFIPVVITEDIGGHKLGEFSFTRTFKAHTVDKKTKKK